MKFIDSKTIKLDRELNELDKFVLNFIKILKKHTNYVIVSGYVSIILGRNRTTDDIDIIIPEMNKTKFNLLYHDIIKNKYWCLNSSDINENYDLLNSKHSVRFAVKPAVSPNIELKFSKSIYDEISLKNPITIKTNNKELKISFLELQIAFKEEVLKSNKDLEDARHLRFIAKEHLNEELLNKYKIKLRNER